MSGLSLAGTTEVKPDMKPSESTPTGQAKPGRSTAIGKTSDAAGGWSFTLIASFYTVTGSVANREIPD